MPDELVPGFAAENEVETRLLEDPFLRQGLAWGISRPGHPEGRVGMHVADICEEIARRDPRRADLRFLALVHDSMKFRVDPTLPWSPDNDHAVLARRFAEAYTGDVRVLQALELHDEPYWRWHAGRADEPGVLDDVLERIPDLGLYVAFVELDATTEGKDFSFVFWLRYQLAARGLLPPAPPQEGERMLEGGAPTAYVQVLGTAPEDQDAVAAAIAAEAAGDEFAGTCEIMRSADGMRVALLVRWDGESGPHVLSARNLIRRSLQRHPVLLRAKPLEAHAYYTSVPAAT